MKFTAQEEYGLRCILALARASRMRQSDNDPMSLPVLDPGSILEAGSHAGFVTVSAVAESEGLSTQYAGKLFRILAQAGLVESVRGCKGGYALTRPAAEISVADAMAALGGKFYEPEVCNRYSGDRRFCVHTNDCSVRSLWSGLQLMIDAVLERTTLEELVTSERSMSEWMQKHLESVGDLLQQLDTALSPLKLGVARVDAGR